jgi:hypothetical protein
MKGAIIAWGSRARRPVDYFLTTVLVLSCFGFLFFLSFFCELLPLPIA